MVLLDIPRLRLASQRIATPSPASPAEIVSRLGAVQAQDYLAAKWALGLRIPGATDAGIEQAYDRGEILRTHVLRPTWHFVAPADIRWMLALTAPRIHGFSAYYYRRMELDEPVFRKSETALEKALRDGPLTRAELGAALQAAGLATGDLRFPYLIMHAELQGLLCSGPRRGKQPTYALLEQRVAPAPARTRDEALAELAARYFTGHGPATLQDFTWWSGLSAADARAGIDAVRTRFAQAVVDDKTYWFPEPAASKAATPDVYLLPNYDEYIVAYADRSAIARGVAGDRLDARGNVLFNHILVVDGQITGTWKRALRKSGVEVELNPFRELTGAEQAAVSAAVERYAIFLGLPARLKYVA